VVSLGGGRRPKKQRRRERPAGARAIGVPGGSDRENEGLRMLELSQHAGTDEAMAALNGAARLGERWPRWAAQDQSGRCKAML
jgi:hypothetical protein